jgi:precorrin-6Y C5,15-methyltransferase (decarboxylating)
MKRINVIGVFPGKPLCHEAVECLNDSDIIFSGHRNREFFEATNKLIVDIGEFKKFRIDMENAYKLGKKITVVATGDPLFYGIGKYISENYPGNEIEIIPEVSSMQVALSRIAMDSSAIYTVSLHGRNIQGLAQKIRNKYKIVIFTDTVNTPSTIADYMIRFGLTSYRAHVFENMGYSNEKSGSYSIEELKGREFDPLNIMILTAESEYKISMPDDGGFTKRNGNITKKEVRDISLSDLDIDKNTILWDIGSGSGSLAIAASFTDTEGEIYAIEKDAELCKNIQSNMEMSGCDIKIINGIAPEILHQLPDPDAIFIGGSSGQIREIMDYSYKRLKIDGRMVINLTTIENFQRAMDYIKSMKLKADISQINISKLTPVSKYTRFVPMDQIYIIRVVKNE